jgi:hypothetical protein
MGIALRAGNVGRGTNEVADCEHVQRLAPDGWVDAKQDLRILWKRNPPAPKPSFRVTRVG